MSGLRKGRVHTLVVAFLLGAFLLLSCQPAQPVATPKPGEKAAATAKPAEQPVRGGTLRISYWGDPPTLDAQLTASLAPLGSMYDLLIEPDKDGNLTKDGLFKDWTISGDGKSITFKLQGGVKFHDGTDLDAAAVKWGIERMKDPANKSPYAFNYAGVEVQVVDPLTVRFNLKAPDPLILTRLTTQGGAIASPTAVQKLGQDFGRKPVGSGAFQLVEWVPGDRITLKKFDGYWAKDKAGNQLPYLDGVVIKIVPDPDVSFANLRTGQADIYSPPLGGLPPEQLALLKADANLTSVAQMRSNANGVWMNTKTTPFSNKALRQAVALAVDKEGLAGRMGEAARLQTSALHPYTWAYDGKAGVFPARDLAKAKAKMAEAGYPSGGLKVSYITSSDDVKNAEILKANLAEIGIDMAIEVVAFAERQTRVQAIGAAYQMASGGLLNGLPDPGHLYGLEFHSKGSRNYLGPYSNPQLDQLLDKAGSIYDQAERTTLYRQAADIIADDAPFVPTYVVINITPMTKKVRDYTLGATETIGLRRVWLAK